MTDGEKKKHVELSHKLEASCLEITERLTLLSDACMVASTSSLFRAESRGRSFDDFVAGLQRKGF